MLRGAACDLSLLLHGCRVNGSFNGWWSVTAGAGSKAFSVLKTHTLMTGTVTITTAVERKKTWQKQTNNKGSQRVSGARALDGLSLKLRRTAAEPHVGSQLIALAGTSRKIGATLTTGAARATDFTPSNKESGTKTAPKGLLQTVLKYRCGHRYVCSRTNTCHGFSLPHSPFPARGRCAKVLRGRVG